MKKLIYFDADKFNASTSLVNRILLVLQNHMTRFNELVDEQYKIKTTDDLFESIFTYLSYIRLILMKDKDFTISGTKLSEEKAFQLGLVELPDWHERVSEFSEKTVKSILELSPKSNPINPYNFRRQDFVLEVGEVTRRPNLEAYLKEQFSFYLNPEKEEEFNLLEKLIEFTKQRLPIYDGNEYSRIQYYLQKSLEVVPDGKTSFKIMPNTSVFSN